MQPSVYLITINPDDTYSEADSLLNAHLIRVDYVTHYGQDSSKW